MSFDLRDYIENDVLVFELSGDLSRIEINTEMLNTTRPLMRSINLRLVLFDFRNVERRMSVGDAFYFVRDMPAVENFFRCALLESCSQQEFSKFYEATARNAGHHIRIFFDRDKAMEWLRSG
ncbi:MAG: hypothetical protein AB7E32_12485 [Desulfovibrio sp.]